MGYPNFKVSIGFYGQYYILSDLSYFKLLGSVKKEQDTVAQILIC